MDSKSAWVKCRQANHKERLVALLGHEALREGNCTCKQGAIGAEFANDFGTLVCGGCLLQMIDLRLGQRLSSLLPAILVTNSSRRKDSSSQPRRNDQSPRQAPPCWTIYVADFDRLLAVSQADDKAD